MHCRVYVLIVFCLEGYLDIWISWLGCLDQSKHNGKYITGSIILFFLDTDYRVQFSQHKLSWLKRRQYPSNPFILHQYVLVKQTQIKLQKQSQQQYMLATAEFNVFRYALTKSKRNSTSQHSYNSSRDPSVNVCQYRLTPLDGSSVLKTTFAFYVCWRTEVCASNSFILYESMDRMSYVYPVQFNVQYNEQSVLDLD